ncbi:MAG: hypothetical protein R2873_10600 [Caldilineaceae bacterium]
MANVVRVNVSLTDVNRFADMDAIYRSTSAIPIPRNTIGVKELWGGAQVGFDVWAVVSNDLRFVIDDLRLSCRDCERAIGLSISSTAQLPREEIAHSTRKS